LIAGFHEEGVIKTKTTCQGELRKVRGEKKEGSALLLKAFFSM